MYCHFMVPVDGSVLSAANVETAVRLAAQLKARITFFHATADLAATGDGALLRTITPNVFTEAAIGDTNAVLSKARFSAQAAGVACDTESRTCDRPAEAIVETAQSLGCDLIVMASRGVRGIAGWLHTSQTERVLKQSTVALLVTRVAATDPFKASERALAVIQDEHRSIAVVVRGMQELVQKVADTGESLDLRSMEAMLAYLQAFPLQLHHPKEERYIHRWLRQRTPESESVLLELEAQHVREHALVAEAVRFVKLARTGDLHAAATVVHLVPTLAQAVWSHMGLEESTVLPMAKKHFLEEDWTEIAQAFESNNDPGFGEMPESEFRQLFTRIANQLPATPPEM